MRIVEQLLRSRWGDPGGGEDVIAVAPGHVAVIDGATSRAADDAPATRGRFAATILAESLAEVPLEADARSAFDFMTRRLSDHLDESQLRDPARRPSAAAVIVSVPRREVWRVADCSYLINGRPFLTGMDVDRYSAGCRAAFLEASLAAGSSIEEFRKHDIGADLIRPLVRAAAYLRNQETPSQWAYGALDGTPIPTRFLEVRRLPNDETEVVLASDGYPAPKASLLESENALKELLAEDPLMFRRHQGTRGMMEGMESFDDRAYLRIIL